MNKKTEPVVAVVMGSDSDLAIMQETGAVLAALEITYEMRVISAHRTPDKARDFALSAAERGIKVVIAAAGKAAHLAGMLAAHTLLPVIGVPVAASDLGGLDSLLSTVQMPGGIPVATVTIGQAGAKNAAILAVEILALTDPDLRVRLQAQRTEMAANVEAADRQVNQTQ